ncbi:MAG: helix-turn-helix domain-containing protein [Gemmatimonadales bacterium]
MKVSHLLLLDHDPARCDVLAGALRAAGHRPIVVPDAPAAALALDVPGLDLVVLALEDPGLDRSLLRRSLAPAESAPPESLEAAERHHIAIALRYTDGNKRRAAHLLGIARSTLLAKVRKYGLDAPTLDAAASNGE